MSDDVNDILSNQGWMDMDVAPRTGCRVELRIPTGDVETGFWRDDTGWNMDGMYFALDCDFTGWREV
jgi:hypothetical protein